MVNKPLDWTSFQVVQKIRYCIKKHCKLKKIKIGHAGTLDPKSSGLLIICTGKMTKNISEFSNLEKHYSGKIKFGVSTISLDKETPEIGNANTFHLNKKLIQEKANTFIGKTLQKPPIFSAIHVKGKRLYEYARKGEKVEIKEREIHITKFNIDNYNNPIANFSVRCSKGTYIRSLANDLALKLNTIGYLYSLQRDKIGPYKLENSETIESICTLIQQSNQNLS